MNINYIPPLPKYPSLTNPFVYNPGKIEFVEGERASGKRNFVEKCLAEGIPVMDHDHDFEWIELPDNYEIAYDSKTTSIIMKRKEAETLSLEELMEKGLTFKQANAVMKERNQT